jgi:poly(3-hydroxybutyrate) depolymerase
MQSPGKNLSPGSFLLSLLLLLFLLLPPLDVEAAKIRVRVETPGGIQQNVFLSRPVHLAPDRPVVFVLHGVGRNAGEYRDQWHELALQHDFLLVVPEFSERLYPGVQSYNLGNVFDREGRARPKAEWSFSTIETIFEEVRRRFGMTARSYAIYGHSAGAQFLHGFLFHLPDARVNRAVAAGAGWYTMPVFDVAYPHGLRGSVVSSRDLAAALQRPLTVLLGEADGDALQPGPGRTPEVLAQGPHRLARGQAFFSSANDAATALGVPFGWRLLILPGAGDDDRLMAPAAIPALLEESDDARPAPGEQDRRRETERLPDVLPATGP